MIKVYKNGNCIVSISLNDGTKERFTMDDEFEPAFAENMDVKITDRCTGTGCPMCHEGSGVDGKHGNLMNAKWVDTLHPYTELACLEGGTMVHTEHGAKEIKDIHVGDYIFDKDHILRKVINVATKIDDVYEIKGKKGLKVRCSADHPFIIGGKMECAAEIESKKIDVLESYKERPYREKLVIDMANYITPHSGVMGCNGGRINDDGTIRIYGNSYDIPRYIEIDEDLMWMYGLYISEGSYKGIVINKDEFYMGHKAADIWKEKTGLESVWYSQSDKQGAAIEFMTPAVLSAVFEKHMNAGNGSRNKTLDFLYSIKDRELVRYALFGVLDGDGSFRERKTKNGSTTYSVSLKTTSKKLAYDYAYLMKKWFDIPVSVFYGMSPERKIEGRTLAPSDYYQCEFYGLTNCYKFYGDLIDLPKPTNRNKTNSNEGLIESVTNLGYQDTLYDITLDDGSHIFPINGYYLTHNCGGGNVFEHPDLIPFLHKLKEKKVIANITVNQVHFKQYYDLIVDLMDRGLVHGVGVSMTNPATLDIDLIKKHSNIVVHTIVGITNEYGYKKLMNNNLKVLLLGYKRLRRGESFAKDHEDSIEQNTKWLEDHIFDLTENCKVVSFDNLALEQLKMKKKIEPDVWEQIYMGDEGTFTYYIDTINGVFAESSVAPLKERFPLLDNVDEMFQIIRSNRKMVVND